MPLAYGVRALLDDLDILPLGHLSPFPSETMSVPLAGGDFNGRCPRRTDASAAARAIQEGSRNPGYMSCEISVLSTELRRSAADGVVRFA
jgi:hypothetical protein